MQINSMVNGVPWVRYWNASQKIENVETKEEIVYSALRMKIWAIAKMFRNFLIWQIWLVLVNFQSVVNMSTALKGSGTVAVVNSKIRKMKGKQIVFSAEYQNI